MMMRRKVVFMAAMLAASRPTPFQPSAKIGLNRWAQVGVLVRELLGAAPRAAVADGSVVEVDHLVAERAAVLDREPGRAQARRSPDRVGIAEAAVDGPWERIDEAHAVMIGISRPAHHRPAVGAEGPEIRHRGAPLGPPRAPAARSTPG